VQGIREERDVVVVVCCEGSPQGSFLIPGAVNLVELATRKWADTGTSIFDDFAHGIHVTERRYFEAQKHTFPFSLWRMYDTRTEYNYKEFVATRNSAVNPLEPDRGLRSNKK